MRQQWEAELLLAPGVFLIDSLGWAAILVPLHLYAIAYAVVRSSNKYFPKLHLSLPLAAMIIPAVATLDHIITLSTPPPLPALFVDTIGWPISIFLILLIVSLITVATVH